MQERGERIGERRGEKGKGEERRGEGSDRGAAALKGQLDFKPKEVPSKSIHGDTRFYASV